MDNFFTIPDESLTCVALKEDGHQDILGSVGLRKDVEEPWAIERVVMFFHSLGCRETTLKSDTEPAIIAFRTPNRSRVQGRNYNRDAVEGDVQTNGFTENTVMQLRGNRQNNQVPH